MNAVDLSACSFEAWYSTFRPHTFESRLIPLESAAVEYFLADGVFLPQPDEVYPTRAEPDEHADEDDYSSWTEEKDDGNMPPLPSYMECLAGLEDRIAECIKELGGRVVPRLNWSCPKDAIWVSPSQSLACSVPGEVLLLLKSSDRASHDLAGAWDSLDDGMTSRPQPLLVLREYFDLLPHMEFRCFVKNHRIIAISQRDVTSLYPELQGREAEIADAVMTFHEKHVNESFPLPDYVIDVYITKKMRVRIIDFNPVAGTTQPLLFRWDELPYNLSDSDEKSVEEVQTSSAVPPRDDEVDVRFITDTLVIQPGERISYGVPYDLVDNSEGSALGDMLRQLEQATMDNSLE